MLRSPITMTTYYDHREAIDHDIEANMEEAVRREFGL